VNGDTLLPDFVAGLYGCLGHHQTGTVAINAEDVLW
jgi:hypothetical protein